MAPRTSARAAALLAAALLVAPPFAGAAEPTAEPAGPVAVTARVLLDAARPEAELDTALLGRAMTLEIVATGPKDVELFAPTRPATGPFRLAETLPGARRVDGETVTETYRFALVPMRVGVQKIPPIEVPWRFGPAGDTGSASTPTLPVRVRGRLENEQNPALGPAPPPRPVITTNWLLVWALSVGAALLFAALVTFLVLRALEQRFRALEPPPPPRPANEVAHERLDALDAIGSELDGAERLARTIDILRDYLGERYGFDALEMTTPELRAALASCDLKTVGVTPIEELLAYADLVKFARITPADEAARERATTVREIVDATWEPPASDEDEDEDLTQLDPATLTQRLYAAGIDVAIAGAVGALVLTALWVGGAQAWGWTALVATGALLTFRDALGRSAGKRLLGLGLVSRRALAAPVSRAPSASGAPNLVARAGRRLAPTVRQLVTRNALLLLWPLTLTLELLVLRRHPLRLRLGDLLAETAVVQGGPR